MGVVLGAVALGGFEKQITIVDEGRPIAVGTYAASVGEALSRAGVSWRASDRVSPPLTSRVTDGLRIHLHRAKEIVLLLDGRPRRVVVTALTVDEALREINLRRATLADYVGPSRTARVRPGMTVEYRRAVAVSVVADGRTQEVITNAADVAGILRELAVSVGPEDRVEPAPSTPPSDGLVVRVRRVEVRDESVRVSVPRSTRTVRDSALEYGVRRVVESGRDGIRLVRYRAIYEDGRRVSRTLVASAVVRTPTARLVAIGSAMPACRCDRGSARGLATWYRASGLSAAHRTLALGTVVLVRDLETGRSVSVVIRDRGPYGDARIIDLSDDAFARLAPLADGVLRVEIRW